jgi:hypothetical protein
MIGACTEYNVQPMAIGWQKYQFSGYSKLGDVLLVNSMHKRSEKSVATRWQTMLSNYSKFREIPG